MTECLFLAYCDAIDGLRAERLLDAAQAAAYPYMGKGAGDWWRATASRIQAAARQTNANVREVKNWLRSVLGGGFSE